MDIPTRFDFTQSTDAVLPEKTPRRKGKTFIALIAPPNITGNLHMGHALENTLLDALIRFKKISGYRVVWFPGTDHASIATQNVVEKELRKQGLTRQQVGKEEFLKRAWQWREKYGGIILDQFKKLGLYLNWDRLKFTMDKPYVAEVEKAFVTYYRTGLAYRAKRTINWCPRCQTSLSDLEIENEPMRGTLHYLKYPVIQSQKSKGKRQKMRREAEKYITVATTRPETIYADVAVAVNPTDTRYKNLVGQFAELPIVGRRLPIVADARVDPKVGTGALKVTPGHSVIDYEIGLRHKLPMLQVIDKFAKMVNVPGYNGASYLDARSGTVEKLRVIGAYEKSEEFDTTLPRCERCHAEIQPLPSPEWFVKMEGSALTDIAKRAVAEKRVELVPKRYERSYLHWLANIRDWCVSRNLWWGQQMPVYYCQSQKSKVKNQKEDIEDGEEQFVVALKQPKRCPFCRKCKMERTDAVFDTWFSSAIWPFGILYGSAEKAYYPADFVSCAKEILHLWITRMIFSGIYFRKRAPFRRVFIHQVVLTKEGKRMSKSLGTGIDPLDLIAKYGVDATRFGLIWQTSMHQELRFDETAILQGQKFVTKFWNAVRFYLVKRSELPWSSKPTPLDRTMEKRVSALEKRTMKLVDGLRFKEALEGVYQFFWHDLCDRYLENAKKGKVCERPFRGALVRLVRLIHPFLPAVTVSAWRLLGQKKSIL